MPYGGLFPFKTDAGTPVIGDIVVADYDSIKFTHEPAFLGLAIEKARYESILLNSLNLSDTFFDDGDNEYPIIAYDQGSNFFTAQYFKINTFDKLNALLAVFQLFAKRDYSRARLIEAFYTARNTFADKLVIATSGAKYEYSGTVFKQNYDLIGGYPTGSVDVYKRMVQDMIFMYLGLDINVPAYLSWITYELLPVGSPTKFTLSFDITTDEKHVLAQQIAWLTDNGFCLNMYKLLYDVFEDILAF